MATEHPAFAFLGQLKAPYYIVVFTSLKRLDAGAEYGTMAAQMAEKVAQQQGYLGAHSWRDADGFGITISYWSDDEAIKSWKSDGEHQQAQANGRERWYEHYRVEVAKVERAYG